MLRLRIRKWKQGQGLVTPEIGVTPKVAMYPRDICQGQGIRITSQSSNWTGRLDFGFYKRGAIHSFKTTFGQNLLSDSVELMLSSLTQT